jgi:hypothetical protein
MSVVRTTDDEVTLAVLLQFSKFAFFKHKRMKSQWTQSVTFDCTLIGDTSLDVSPVCHYHSPPTLLLNVPGQIAAFWEINKKIHEGLSERNALYT